MKLNTDLCLLRKFLCFLLLIILSNKLIAQVTADFSTSVQQGCGPLFVQFTDASQGNPIQWIWDLGNGATSALQNPSTIYINPGTYTVTLTAKNAAGENTVVKKNILTVLNSPTVGLTASTTDGCAPLNVSFFDNSLPGSGNIQSYIWDFGDGITSTDQNPKHIYTISDTFSVTLKVTNNFGCTQTLQSKDLIRIGGEVESGFTYTYSNVCSPPATVLFANTSVGSSSLSYEWYFGDGSFSSDVNPKHTYSTSGSFKVKLVTTNKQGCSDVHEETISIGSAKADFTFTSACTNEAVFFSDASSSQPLTETWDFGDGTTGIGATTTHVYNTDGSYLVTLTANFGACTDVVKKVIKPGEKPVAAFGITGNAVTCNYPVTLQFTNKTTGAGNFMWLFDDGTTSSETSPSHTYDKKGSYSVTLIAFNANGCPDTLARQDVVQLGPPKIFGFDNIPFKGCAPQTITFRPSLFAPDPITSFKWSFGDGTFSTDSVPKHTYSKVGSYNVKLIIATDKGCTDSLEIVGAVQVGTKPSASFSADPLKSCAGDAIQFTDESTGLITDWLWVFGDGGSSSEQDPLYFYKDTGYFKVALIVSEFGCSDTLIKDKYVYLKPPVSKFGFVNDCANPLVYNFTDSSIAPETWKWNFGDGNTETTPSPSHTFSKAGIYPVSLTVTNGKCSYTRTDSVNVVNENPSFEYKPEKSNYCKYDSVKFYVTQYQPGNLKAFYWDFGDGNTAGFSPNLDTAYHFYTEANTFNPYLIVKDINGCIDTVKNKSLEIHVYGPTAAFSNKSGGCLVNNVTFNDESYSDGVHPIKTWTWFYGDGSTPDTLTSPPFAHSYTKTGSYDVKLKVKDSNGCYDSIVNFNAVETTSPVAAFSVDSLSCSGSALQFNDSSYGISIGYIWDFGDGNTSANPAPQHIYNSEGTYNIKLLITDKYNCKDSLIKQSSVKVIDPKAIFTLPDSLFTCPPANIQPQNNSLNYTSLLWVFDDGNTSSEITPTHLYNKAGTYNIKLIAQGYGSCFDTASQNIVLKGPKGELLYNQFTGCNPLSVSFIAKSTNTVQYFWDYGNGITEKTTDSLKLYTYLTPGKFLPKLVIVDTSGCKVSLENADTILVYGAEAKFSTAPGNSVCDSLLINFSDSSTAFNDNINSYTWDFGDGNSSATQTPKHYYATSNTYNSTLKITTEKGCESTYQLPVNIAIQHKPQVVPVIPDSACVNASVLLNASLQNDPAASVNWLWNMGTGDTSAQQSLNYTYTTAKNYRVSVIATTTGGCADTASRNITINGLPIIDAGEASVICLGNSVSLKSSGGSAYTWQNNNSLSCLDCNNPVAKPEFTTTYFVAGTNTQGCLATDSVIVEVKRPAKVSITAPDSLCVGSVVQLSAGGEEQYRWLPANLVSNANGAQTSSTPQTTTTYTVIGSDSKNCFSDTAFATVNIFRYPTINIPDSLVSIEGGTSYTMNILGSEDINYWEWSPVSGLSCINCPQPTVTPRITTKYTVKARNIVGCTTEKNITVTVICKNENLFIPNTFSPNYDGMNDYFYPRGKGFTVKSFRIFSRWGNIVYEKTNFAPNDQSAGWNGSFKNKPLQSDVYVYILEIICDNGNIINSKGNVTLLR